MTIRVAVSGASGRLGRVVVEEIEAAPGLLLHAAMTSRSAPEQMLGAEVLVDATLPEVSEGLVRFALEHGLNAVIGTSGWDEARIRSLRRELPAGRGALVVPNFSLASVLASHLAVLAAEWLDRVEIVEAHHESKADAPSGTAVRTAERLGRVLAGRGGPAAADDGEPAARGQEVAGVRVHSLRLPGVVAEQRVLLGGRGEVLEIRHETLSSEAYRPGIRAAIQAAPGLQGVVVGLAGVLGLPAEEG
ncbi:MAG: 4-hydroxy-tetrahydrodipicolinate reductase [Pseudoclavibacter sp.]|nr:4-hydroxy-tetrahydrodipicolinate reductase [Pseudoclavibacter sp.]